MIKVFNFYHPTYLLRMPVSTAVVHPFKTRFNFLGLNKVRGLLFLGYALHEATFTAQELRGLPAAVFLEKEMGIGLGRGKVLQ